jgi:hypothetical protein
LISLLTLKKTYPSTLYNIAEKISKNLPLSIRELAIQSANGTEIEKLLKEKKDSEPKIDTLEEKIKNMTQEDIKKLEEEKKLLLEEEEKGVAKISSLEQKIAEKEAKVVVLENEGKENSADKQAEIDRRKKEIESEFTKQFSKEKRTELEKTLTAELQNSRMGYVEAYKEKVDSKKNWFGTKLKHWIGYKHRDTIVEKDIVIRYMKQNKTI